MEARFDQLRDRYGHLAPVVIRGGRTYPVAIEPLRGARPEDIIWSGGGEASLDPRLLAEGEAHLAALRRRGAGLEDRPLAVMRTLADAALEVSRSRYFAMIATCDVLRAEYLACAGAGERTPGLALRTIVDEGCGDDPLHSGRGRAAGVGVSVLTTVTVGSRRAFVVGRRRAELATDAGQWHLAPSGMLESHDARGSLLHAVERELREELRVLVDPAALRERLTALGVAHDLLRLRPELCLRLDLEDSELRGTRVALSQDEFAAHELVGLSSAGLKRFWHSRRPHEVTPPAAGAIALVEAAS